MNNPKVKKGDAIIIKQSNNGPVPTNVVMQVTSLSSEGNFSASYEGRSYNIFNTVPSDVYILAKREDQIASLKEVIAEIKEDLSNKEKALNHLLLYETEEDFVATKLDELISAHSNSKNPADRIKLMSEILKTMKDSHLI